VAFTSDAGTDNTYKTGDIISISIAFSETVTVTGSPQIPIAGLTSKVATYSSGSGTNTLVFTYTIAALDTDTDGLAITADTLALNAGTIKDAPGNNATITHSAVATQSAHKVDAITPTVTNVTFTSDAGTDNTYRADDIVSISVTFSETVTITSSPRIPIAGLTSKFATYSSGSGTNTLVFTYTIVTGDTDTNGLAITANTLELNSGTIRDAASNNATLTHAAVADQSAHKVDTAAPTMNITSNLATVASGATATITFTSNKSTTTFDQSDVSVTLGTITSFSGSSGTYTATFTGSRSSGGIATISVDAEKFTDAVGNGNTVSNTHSITVTNTTSSTGGRTSYVGNGTIGDNGTEYIVERFTTTGTPNWRVPNGVTSIDYLIIGGGGAGGPRHAGGGGAGGVRSSVAST
jgi:hypothetical protein